MTSQMQPALIVLKDQSYLIALSETLEYEPKCHLYKPHTVTGDKAIIMKPWPRAALTDELHILLHSDSLLTVVEPTAELRAKYLKKIGLKEEDLVVKEEPEQVLLNEDEATPDWIDDYEPRYAEG